MIILNIEAQHATEDARYIEKLDALGIPAAYVDFRNMGPDATTPGHIGLNHLQGQPLGEPTLTSTHRFRASANA